jgi:hypothetical protein
VWLVFYFYPSLFRCLFVVQLDFCPGFIPVMRCAWVDVTPSTAPPHTFPHPVLFNSFQQVSVCLVPTQMQGTSLLFVIFLPLFSSSLGLLYQSHFWIHALFIVLYIDNIACICIGPIFHKWEKTCGLWLFKPG